MAVPPLTIPFNRPAIVGRELEYIRDAVAAMHISGDGGFTRRCADLLESELGVQAVLLTPSCTDALELAAILLDIEPGDEFVVPAFTFVSAVNAFVLRGARPVFVDIRPDTLNLDAERVESAIGPRTRAVVTLHYAGMACEIERLARIARERDVALIEDNAHSLFGTYRGKPLGTFGCLATQSFHETKNINCGEGGALLINDPSLISRAEIIRDKGTDRQRFLRGQVDKYTWVDLGSSFVLSDLLAAFLLAQLEKRREIQTARRTVWQRYESAFRGEIEEFGVQLPTVPEGCEQAWHMYYLILPSLPERQGLIDHLRQRGIGAVFHYTPLHLSRMGLAHGGVPGDCPVTERTSDRLLRLPFFFGLTGAEQQRVIDAVFEFLRR